MKLIFGPKIKKRSSITTSTGLFHIEADNQLSYLNDCVKDTLIERFPIIPAFRATGRTSPSIILFTSSGLMFTLDKLMFPIKILDIKMWGINGSFTFDNRHFNLIWIKAKQIFV